MDGWGWMEGLCSCKAEWCAGIPHFPSQIADTRFTCIGALEEGDFEGGWLHFRRVCGTRFLPVNQAHSSNTQFAERGGHSLEETTVPGRMCHQAACRSDSEPPFPTSLILFASIEYAKWPCRRIHSIGWLQPNVVEASVENLDGHCWCS